MEEYGPEVTRLLEQVMDESTVGDPRSPRKWNSKSTYQIREYLARHGHPVSEDTIQRRLRKLDYSLQANRKDQEGKSHAGTGSLVTSTTPQNCFCDGENLIWVDTQKKERVGNFKNHQRKWRKQGQTPRVNIADFPSLA